MSKKVHIDLIPNDSSPSKRIEISIWRVFLWVFLFFFSIGAAVWLVLHPEVVTHFLQPENKVVQQQQRNLKSNIHDMQSKIDSVSQKIDELNANQTKIRGFIDKDQQSNTRPQPKVEDWADLSNDEILAKVDSLHQIAQPVYDSIFRNSQLKKNLPLGHPMGRPVKVSASYGMRIDPFTGRKLPHFGIDFPCAKGDTIYAPGGGIVSTVGKDRGFGIMMTLNHGRGIETTYAHLAQALVNRQKRVRRGEAIALCGNSGKSTGPHLHYEMSVDDHNFDPMRVIELHQ